MSHRSKKTVYLEAEVFKAFNFFPQFFLLYLIGRETETSEKQVRFINVHKGRDEIELQESVLVPSIRGQEPPTWAITAASQGSHQQEDRSRNWSQNPISGTSVWHIGVLTDILTSNPSFPVEAKNEWERRNGEESNLGKAVRYYLMETI